MLILVEKTVCNGTFQDGEFTCNNCNVTNIWSEVRTDIPKNVTGINLNDNMITDITIGLWGFENCTEISLARNNLSKVHGYSFWNKMHSLEKLVFSENQIAFVRLLSGEDLPALKEIYLDHNKLTYRLPLIQATLQFRNSSP